MPVSRRARACVCVCTGGTSPAPHRRVPLCPALSAALPRARACVCVCQPTWFMSRVFTTSAGVDTSAATNPEHNDAPVADRGPSGTPERSSVCLACRQGGTQANVLSASHTQARARFQHTHTHTHTHTNTHTHTTLRPFRRPPRARVYASVPTAARVRVRVCVCVCVLLTKTHTHTHTHTHRAASPLTPLSCLHMCVYIKVCICVRARNARRAARRTRVCVCVSVCTHVPYHT